LKLADLAVELNEGSAESHSTRASLLVAFGQIQRARQDLLATLDDEIKADAYYGIYQAALLSLALDNRQSYQQLCQRLVATVTENDELTPRHFSAWTAALAPKAVEDYQRAISLAKQSVQEDPDHRQARTALGAIQMRAGLYEQALATLQESTQLESTDSSSAAYAAFFRAMTLSHLGREKDARESLNEAIRLADEKLNDKTKPQPWNRKLTLELLRKEAE
jgi:tetratricopeptide (TPR) repeat protein